MSIVTEARAMLAGQGNSKCPQVVIGELLEYIDSCVLLREPRLPEAKKGDQPGTLDKLSLAISYLRTPGQFPETANALAMDVVPVLRSMAKALTEILADMESVAPNYRAAESIAQARAALAAFEAGRLPSPTKNLREALSA